MKLIIAILREERVEKTKGALETLGVRGVTFLHITGRGQQKGRASVREPGDSLNRRMRLQMNEDWPGEGLPDPDSEGSDPRVHDKIESAFGFLPKRMAIIVAHDEELNGIVRAIVHSNLTGRHGDGRIFICPMVSAIRVRTGEQGDKALS